MRRILLILAVFISVNTFSQVELTPEGVVFSETENNYKVYEFEDLTAAELYNRALIHFNSTYVSPKDVISKVDGEMITINAVGDKVVRRTNAHRFDMNYTIMVRFKDGKVRVDNPVINSMSTIFNGKHSVMHIVSGFSLSGDFFGIYKPDGSLRISNSKEDIESFFNSQINGLLESFETIETEDW